MKSYVEVQGFYLKKHFFFSLKKCSSIKVLPRIFENIVFKLSARDVLRIQTLFQINNSILFFKTISSSQNVNIKYRKKFLTLPPQKMFLNLIGICLKLNWFYTNKNVYLLFKLSD